MSKLFLSAAFVFQILFVLPNFAAAQTGKTLKFTDGLEIKTIAENYTRAVDSVKISEREIIANYNGIGKAIRLSTEITGEIRNKKLVGKLKAITSAFELSQDDRKFYISALNSAYYEKLRDCENCRVRCKLILIEITSADGVWYVPLVKSIKEF